MYLKSKALIYPIIAPLLLFAVSCMSCGNAVTNSSSSTKNYLYTQYAYLLEQSFEYEKENKSFRKEIANAVDTVTRYVMATKTRMSPINNEYNRTKEPIILLPYLFNNKKDKVIVMVLSRQTSTLGDKKENVNYLIGKKENVTENLRAWNMIQPQRQLVLIPRRGFC